MKTTIILSLLLASSSLLAQDPATDQPTNKKRAHLDIRTSTVCDMCVATIEGNLIYEKGVKSVDVELATNEIHVDYDPRKNSPENLRLAVSKLGYMADDIPGDAEAFKKLPECCQKEGCGLPAEKH
ncbi:MAG: heavy-metal-associated domain-containing protein [Flavobacteriales bacterium]|jgi:copper chaperone CopZ|nr:heavy-metal-associated domain-containing protein [Flavobacteriales bacterium]